MQMVTRITIHNPVYGSASETLDLDSWLAGRAVALNKELFISSATLSGYIVEAELADAIFRGAGQDIDFDTDFDVSRKHAV